MHHWPLRKQRLHEDQQQKQQESKSSEVELPGWPQTMLWLPCKTRPCQHMLIGKQHKVDKPKGTPAGSGPTSINSLLEGKGIHKETWNLSILTLAQGRIKKNNPVNLSTQVDLHTGLRTEFSFFLSVWETSSWELLSMWPPNTDKAPRHLAEQISVTSYHISCHNNDTLYQILLKTTLVYSISTVLEVLAMYNQKNRMCFIREQTNQLLSTVYRQKIICLENPTKPTRKLYEWIS